MLREAAAKPTKGQPAARHDNRNLLFSSIILKLRRYAGSSISIHPQTTDGAELRTRCAAVAAATSLQRPFRQWEKIGPRAHVDR
jgi:hypothetical protein